MENKLSKTEREEKLMIYRLRSANLTWLEERVEALNKRAKRLKCEPITIEIMDRYEDVKVNPVTKVEIRTLMHRIRLHGISPKLNGWSFAGTIEHTSVGNIMRLVTNSEVPSGFRSVKKSCDHCNKDRRRKDTYLAEHEDGRFFQLGKNCLKDYLGHRSLKMLADIAKFIDELVGAEYEEMEFSTKWGKNEVPPDIFLRYCCESVVRHGAFVTAKQADFSDGESSTASDAWFTCFPPKASKEFPQWKINEAKLKHTEAGLKLYENVVKAIEVIGEDANDFQHNVKMTFGMEVIEFRHKGILAAGILIHERNLIQKLELKNNQDCEFVGEIKKRQEFILTIEKTYSFESYYGLIRIIKMRDENNNIVVWKTGTGFPRPTMAGVQTIGTGSVVRIKATIKAHTVYQGTKQTQITRATLIEDLSQNEAESVAS